MGSAATTRCYHGGENGDDLVHTTARGLLPLSDEFNFVPRDNHVKDLRDEFDWMEKLGSGSTSSVWLMTRKATGLPCAVKKMHRYHKKCITRSFQREAQVLQKINHDHVVRLVGVYVDCTHYYIAQEVCTGGTLWDRAKTRPLSEEEAIDVSYQILDAVKFLHNHNIVHRDIKPTNIMYKNTENNEIVLVDFGGAREIQDTDVFNDWVGTPAYMSPEVTRMRTGGELKKIDVWAVGVTVYILVTNHLPFYGNNKTELLQEICQRPLRFPDGGETKIARKFIASLLRRRLERRLSAAEAMQHEWLEPARTRRAPDHVEIFSSDEDDSTEFKQVAVDIDIDCVYEATINLMDRDDGGDNEEEYAELLRERMIADRAKMQGKVVLEVGGDGKTLTKEANKNVYASVGEEAEAKMIDDVDRNGDDIYHALKV